jgi:protein ImuB
MGEGRAGSAAVVDSYRPGAFTMTTFAPERSGGRARAARTEADEHLPVALRRFRIPVPARVTTKADGRPDQVMVDRRGLAGGHVDVAAGPWRTSGEWWRVSEARLQSVPGTRPVVGWNRDEWDVALSDGAVYRIYRDRDRDRWFVDGVID